MQFVVISLDGNDGEAIERRAKYRPAHIEYGEKMRQAGTMWYGAALTDGNGNMNGSMILVNFPSRKELDKWLEEEPYVLGEVWKDIKVYPANVRDPWQYSQSKDWFERLA